MFDDFRFSNEFFRVLVNIAIFLMKHAIINSWFEVLPKWLYVIPMMQYDSSHGVCLWAPIFLYVGRFLYIARVFDKQLASTVDVSVIDHRICHLPALRVVRICIVHNLLVLRILNIFVKRQHIHLQFHSNYCPTWILYLFPYMACMLKFLGRYVDLERCDN